MVLLNNYLNQNQDEEQKKKQLQTSTGSSTVIQGGAGGSQSAVTPAAPLEKKSNTQGTGFINMDAYLKENQVDSKAMTGALAGKLKEDVTKTSEPVTSQAKKNIESVGQVGFQTDPNLFLTPEKINKEDFASKYNYDFDPTKYTTPNFGEAEAAFQGMLDRTKSNDYTGEKLVEQYGQGRLYGSGMGTALDKAILGSTGDFRKQAEAELAAGKSGVTSAKDQYQAKMGLGGEFDTQANQARDAYRKAYEDAYANLEGQTKAAFTTQPKYEQYTGKEYSTMTDFLKAEEDRKALEARNKQAYNTAVANLEQFKGKQGDVLSKLNALGALTGKGAQKIDFSKLGVQGPGSTVANTYKEIPISVNTQSTNEDRTDTAANTIITAGQKAGQTLVKKPIDVGVTDIKKVAQAKLPDTVPNIVKKGLYSGGGSGQQGFTEGDKVNLRNQGYSDAAIAQMEQEHIKALNAPKKASSRQTYDDPYSNLFND